MADVPFTQPKTDLRIRLPPIQPDHEILASPVPTPVAPVAVVPLPRTLPPLHSSFNKWLRAKL
jgi:hypothetical protein